MRRKHMEGSHDPILYLPSVSVCYLWGDRWEDRVQAEEERLYRLDSGIVQLRNSASEPRFLTVASSESLSSVQEKA